MPTEAKGLNGVDGTTQQGTPNSKELPKEDEGKQSKLPKKAEDANGEDAGKSGDSDFNFADLEEKAPDAFKKEIKKAHAWITKTRQLDAEEKKDLRVKLAELEKNQISEQDRNAYGHLVQFYNDLKSKPADRIKGLIQEFNLNPEEILGQTASKEPEITPDDLETRDDYVRWNEQEKLKLKREYDERIAQLEGKISTFEEGYQKKQVIDYGQSKIVEAAQILDGFATKDSSGKLQLTPDALKAIDMVKNYYFTGEDALKNAWVVLRSSEANKKIAEANKKAEVIQRKFEELEKNLKGASPPPKTGGAVETRNFKGNSKDMWAELRKQPLTP